MFRFRERGDGFLSINMAREINVMPKRFYIFFLGHPQTWGDGFLSITMLLRVCINCPYLTLLRVDILLSLNLRVMSKRFL